MFTVCFLDAISPASFDTDIVDDKRRPLKISGASNYSCAGDKGYRVSYYRQVQEGWPDLDLINSCSVVFFHFTSRHVITIDHSSYYYKRDGYIMPLVDELSKIKAPLIFSPDPGDIEALNNIFGFVNNLTPALHLPNTIGILTQSPQQRHAIARMFPKVQAIFLPPLTTALEAGTPYVPFSKRDLVIVPRSPFLQYNGTRPGAAFKRNSLLAHMIAGDVAKEHGFEVSYVITSEYDEPLLSYTSATREANIEDPLNTVTLEDLCSTVDIPVPKALPFTPHWGFLKVLSHSKVVFSLDRFGSWGRYGIDAAVVRTPHVTTPKLFCSELYPYTTCDPFDYDTARQYLERLLFDREFFSKVVNTAYNQVISLCSPKAITVQLKRLVGWS